MNLFRTVLTALNCRKDTEVPVSSHLLQAGFTEKYRRKLVPQGCKKIISLPASNVESQPLTWTLGKKRRTWTRLENRSAFTKYRCIPPINDNLLQTIRLGTALHGKNSQYEIADTEAVKLSQEHIKKIQCLFFLAKNSSRQKIVNYALEMKLFKNKSGRAVL